jgi:hypothetical protein
MIDDVQLTEQIVVKRLLERLRTWLILGVSQGDPSTNTLRLEIALPAESAVPRPRLGRGSEWLAGQLLI